MNRKLKRCTDLAKTVCKENVGVVGRITQLWEVELGYREEDDEFGFRQLKSEIMTVPHGRVMKMCEITDWNSGEKPRHMQESVPFIGEKIRVKPAEEPRPNHGGNSYHLVKMIIFR